MKITILLPEFKDKNIKNFLNELIRQINSSMDDMERQISEMRSENNGKK